MIEPALRGAWRELAARLRPFVARRVADADVDDVLQDIFVRIQRGLDQLRDDQRFGPWVYQVARSAIIDHHRALARRPPIAADAAEEVESADAASTLDDDGDAARELAAQLAHFVAALPSPYREALTLTELEGITQKDAAELLGISLSGMKSRVQRGRARLRAMLAACCEITCDTRGRVIDYARRPGGEAPAGCCGGEGAC
ncbi:MAG: RNA polymerase sigma factor SigZ [Myxococcales bacterium]|nr:RNA polymerase sigma factor SigZ [Myxococcales bacterium]MCB9700953.1 RNA polymerase sigma factor SigZ [Myxococcales bacterium]